MTDLALFAFFALMLAMGFRRPFIWLMAYIYVDILSPHKMSWGIMAALPVSLIAFVFAFGGWLLMERKDGTRIHIRQALMIVFLAYCGLTTLAAAFPEAALSKWAWVWKSLVFAIFMPLTIRTRLRIEAALLVMLLSAGAIIISAGIKAVASGGGGYGVLQSFVADNSGLYEGSTLSMVAVAIIPLIVWMGRHGTIFPPDPRVRLFTGALIFACIATTVGLQTRTGLLCLCLVAAMWLRRARHRFLLGAGVTLLVLIALPFLPASYTQRMNTIETHQADESASTRIAVWKWTLGYAMDNPFGGGFDSYLGNKVKIDLTTATTAGSTTVVKSTQVEDKARAFHSAYFEVLGEQGWPGLLLWLSIHGLGLLQLELLCRRLAGSTDPRDRRDFELANALQIAHLACLLAATFIGVAYQPFIFMIVGLEIALMQQRDREANPAPKRARPGAPRRMKPATGSA